MTLSKYNLSLSTSTRSFINLANSVGFVAVWLRRSGSPAGVGTSRRTGHVPGLVCCSLLRMKLCNSLAPSGWGASFRIAAVCGQETYLPLVGWENEMVSVLFQPPDAEK